MNYKKWIIQDIQKKKKKLLKYINITMQKQGKPKKKKYAKNITMIIKNLL